MLAWSDDSLAGPAVAAQWCLIAAYWVVVQSIHHHSWAMGNGVGGGCRHGHVHGPRAILLFLLSSKIYALFVVFKNNADRILNSLTRCSLGELIGMTTFFYVLVSGPVLVVLLV